MDLVEGQPAQVAALAVARVQVADLGPPAVHRLHAAGRVEEDVAVGQIDAFVVGEAQAVGQLPDRAVRHLHLVQVVVVLAVGFLPGKEHVPAVPRHIRVADHAVGVVDERAHAGLIAVEIEPAQRRARVEVPLVLGVGLALGVGVVRAAQGVSAS